MRYPQATYPIKHRTCLEIVFKLELDLFFFGESGEFSEFGEIITGYSTGIT